MKKIKINTLILVSCFLVGLTGCSKTHNSDDVVQEKPSDTNSIEEGKGNENIPSDSIVASEYIQSVTWAEAYSEGKYVIMGINNEGSNFCGVLYNNGMLKVYDEYFRVYPLKNGRLLATTDKKAKDMSYSKMYIQNATVNGVIIDEMGNIIFSDEKYLRFIPISEDRLFVFKVNAGFEGITFEFGIIDSDGNWIYDLGSNEIAELFIDSFKISSDNTWNFIDSPYDDYIRTSELFYKVYGWQVICKDGKSAQIVIKIDKDHVIALTGQIVAEDPDPIFVTYTYNTETDQIDKGIFNYSPYKLGDGRTSKDLPIQNYVMLSNGQILFSKSGVAWSGNLHTYDSEIDTLSGEKIEELYGFYIGNDYYFVNRNREIKNLVTGQTWALKDSILSHLRGIYENKDIFYLILYGDDKQYYIERVGIDEDPLQLMDFSTEGYSDVIFYDNFFVYYNEYKKAIYVADINTFNVLQKIDVSMLNHSLFKLHKLDSNVFAAEEASHDNFLIYNLNGELVYKK